MFKYIRNLFQGEPQFNGLMLGLDGVGKTTLMYKLSRGEMTTTIPAIGFNVETITDRTWTIRCWDVGGCDKIRPLWASYIDNTDFMVFVHDCTDSWREEESFEELTLFLKELSTRGAKHVFILVNKQDVLKDDEKETKMQDILTKFTRILEPFKDLLNIDILDLPGLSIKTGHQLDTALSYIKQTLRGQKPIPHRIEEKLATKVDSSTISAISSGPTREQLIDRINQASSEAEPHDEVFWNNLMTASVPTWDQFTHLRAGYLIMVNKTSAGTGIDVLKCADHFANILKHLRLMNPDRFRNTTHRTMTIFWLSQLQTTALQYYTSKNSSQGFPSGSEFRDVLLHNPYLMDSGLWKEHYSKEVMFGADARARWCKPDLKPLPGHVPDEEHEVDDEKAESVEPP